MTKQPLQLIAVTALSLAWSARVAPAQDSGEPQEKPPVEEAREGQKDQEAEEPPVKVEHFIRPEFEGVAEPQPQDELLELFGQVERRMRKIDFLLLDASAGDLSKLSEVGESGIGDLLDEATPPQASASGDSPGVAGMLRVAGGEGEAVRRDIDRIIEIAEQMGGQCSSSGSGSQKPSSGSPLDGRPEQRVDKTGSPEEPRQGEQEQPEPKDGDPKSNKDGDDPPRPNQPAANAPDSDTEPAQPVVDDREAWGELPIHVRDVFRAEGGPSMPPRYRDWIDAYYKRLNARTRD